MQGWVHNRFNLEEDKIIEKAYSFPCPSCGGKLGYSAEKQKIACSYCGYAEDYSRANDELIENPLEEAVLAAPKQVVEEIGKKVFNCSGCGSKFMVESDKVKVSCGFCGSDNVNVEAFDHQYIKPAGIIPFQISKAKATSQFETWIKRGWFHPSKLKRLAVMEDLHGIYIPFWTYDAMTDSNWQGQAGYHYYETQRVRVNGQWQQQQVQKTRWKSKSGSLRHFFDDILVVASHGLDQNDINRIFPYKLDQVVNFDPKLMLGWEGEIYDVEVDEGYQRADKIMDRRLYDLCSVQLGGDTQRGLHVQSKKYLKTFKHIILPLWISSYRYQNKIYHFTINGQTGQIGGKKPISPYKVAIAILAFILIILGVVLLAEFLKNR